MITIQTTPEPTVELWMTRQQYEDLCYAVSDLYESLRHDEHDPDIKPLHDRIKDLIELLPILAKEA